MNSSYQKSQALLVIPRLRIQNANAISSPLTHGFPAMSAFFGVMWALERRLNGRFALGFDSVGVVCHQREEQTNRDGYVQTFRLTRNPIDKDGGTAAIVEEGRIHLEITLIFGISGGIVEEDEKARQDCAEAIANELSQMRVAGGTVLPTPKDWRHTPQIHLMPEHNDEEAASRFRALRRRWLPGFSLVARDDLLTTRLETLRSTNPQTTLIDAWLDLSRFNWHPVLRATPKSAEVTPDISQTDAKPEQPGTAPETSPENEKVEWQHDRKKSGWIVPIPVGYVALSESFAAGSIANARDSRTPFRFVESLYSVGEWIAPHRLKNPQELLWYADTERSEGIYRLRNDYAALNSH